MTQIKKIASLLLAASLLLGLLTGCSGQPQADLNQNQPTDSNDDSSSTLVYGSGDYTRINPALDGMEINLLLFNGLTAHDANNHVIPGLAKSWSYDEATHTYTFQLEQGVKWHDGEPFTAEDVKFTIEAIMNPDNESEIFSNYEDVEAIQVIDESTVAFQLADDNVAFLEYMSIGILPEQLLREKTCRNRTFSASPSVQAPIK